MAIKYSIIILNCTFNYHSEYLFHSFQQKFSYEIVIPPRQSVLEYVNEPFEINFILIWTQAREQSLKYSNKTILFYIVFKSKKNGFNVFLINILATVFARCFSCFNFRSINYSIMFPLRFVGLSELLLSCKIFFWPWLLLHLNRVLAWLFSQVCVCITVLLSTQFTDSFWMQTKQNYFKKKSFRIAKNSSTFYEDKTENSFLIFWSLFTIQWTIEGYQMKWK